MRFNYETIGRNRRCIDKNFGGILMIWDHLFGTYEAEGDGDDIQYGLTTPLKTFNPLYVQVIRPIAYFVVTRL